MKKFNSYEEITYNWLKDIVAINSLELYNHLNFTDNIKNNTLLVEIKNNFPKYTQHFPDNKHGRVKPTKQLIEYLCKKKGLPNTVFLVIVNDGYSAKVPSFSSIKPPKNSIYNIPFPLGNIRNTNKPYINTPIIGWDKVVDHYKTIGKKYLWENKIEKAIFRGNYEWQTWKLGYWGNIRSESWQDSIRGKLYELTKSREDLFDVGIKNDKYNLPFNQDNIQYIDYPEQQKYKYILDVGQNMNWSDRSRISCFMNSLILKHESECEEFFTKLLKPHIHYLPIDLHLKNIIIQTEWAKNHDAESKIIAQNMNNFAKEFLCEQSIINFAHNLIIEYTKLLL